MTTYMVLIGVLMMFAASPSHASDADSIVYRCEGPFDTALYTNKKRAGCETISLPELTIAPKRADVTRSSNVVPYGLAPFPSDWFDYAGSVGSLRNRLTQGGLYGMQDWLDYDAPVGAMRNTPTNWPWPYGLYGW